MLIDFHAHVFLDKLAKGAVASLAAKAHFTPYTDGTLSAAYRAACQRFCELPPFRGRGDPLRFGASLFGKRP